jgi:cell wall-associated NlpC family hydrolase
MVAAAAAATMAGALPFVASAAPASPPPANPDPLTQFKTLSAQAAGLDEDLLAAQNDLKNKQAQLAKANTTLTQAQTTEQQAQQIENQFRGEVDQFAAASFDGARLDQLSALLTGTSAQDFLNRATLLNDIAAANDSALTALNQAVTNAARAQQTAASAEQTSKSATDAATQLVTQIQQKQAALNTQITQVKAAMAKLTAAQKATLNNVGDTGTFLGPPGVLNTVIQAALSRRGDPYVWGAGGPGTFDCSGLVAWAYAQAGISLPHSSRVQYTYGKPVAYGAWQPGDLLFFGPTQPKIHHVAMYVGNGEIVQAPTEGVPVQVVPISGGGSDYFGARRIVG